MPARLVPSLRPRPILHTFVLRLISRSVGDGAGDHRSHNLVCPPNITLIPLPPYSPELNPVENLWHSLRSHHWSHRKYDTVDDLFDAAETAWKATCLDPAVIRTVCHAPYAEMRS